MSVTNESQKNIRLEMQKHGLPLIRKGRQDLQSLIAQSSMGRKQIHRKSSTNNTSNLSQTTPQVTENQKHDSLASQRLHKEYATQLKHYESAKPALGQRSSSVSQLKKAQNKLSLQERTILNSKSKVNQILNQTLQGDVRNSTARAKDVLAIQSRRGSSFGGLNMQKMQTKIDPKKIVLEMDLIDKESLLKEMSVMKTDLGNIMSQQEPDKLEPGEQIERVRRILVLNELGIAIPKNNITGEIDIKKLFEYELPTEKDPNEQQNHYSPLKTEKPNSQVLKDIKPLFPLISTNISGKKIDLPDEEYFQKNIREILERKQKLTDFANRQKTQMAMKLKQTIFSERMNRANKYIDYTFKDVSESLMDEEYVLKTYREQIKQETHVQGKPLFPVKDSEFNDKWSKMKCITTHDGQEISKSGQIMSKEFKERKEHLKFLEKKYRKIKQASKMVSGIRIEDASENELIEMTSDSDSKTLRIPKTKVKDNQARLEIVKEDKNDFNTQNSDEEELQDNDSQWFEDQEVAAINKSKGQRKEWSRAMSTMSANSQRSQSKGTQQISHTFSKDPEVKARLSEIERDIFYVTKSDENLSKSFNITLNAQQKKLLNKYHSSIQIKSSNSNKLAINMQQRLLKEICSIVEKQFVKERLRRSIVREQQEYRTEQNKSMNDNLKNKLSHFHQARHQEKEVLEYVLQQEANSSDEEFNHFDQMASNMKPKQVTEKLRSNLDVKMAKVQKEIESELSKKRIDFILDIATLDTVLAKEKEQDQSRNSPQYIKFSPKNRSKTQSNQKEFNSQVSKNYYDEQLKVNQSKPKNEIQLNIQQDLAEVTNKQIFQAQEHKNAMQIYYEKCNSNNIHPLPILNKFQNQTLSLEDYTINEAQLGAFSELLGMFGKNQLQKLYINNNNITDRMMEVLIAGLRRNQYVNSIEIANNEVRHWGMEELVKFFHRNNKQIQILKLSNTRTDLEEAEKLFTVLSQYEHLIELKLQNLKINEASAKLFAHAIQNNMSLEKLDIGWNTMFQSTDLLTIMEAIKGNYHLREVSFNNISVAKSQGMNIAKCLNQFIKNNKRLMHLNISYMHLGELEILHIVKACITCRTLLSIHLTGNEVYSPELRRKLRLMFRPRRRIKDFKEAIAEPDRIDDKDGNPHITNTPQLKMLKSLIDKSVLDKRLPNEEKKRDMEIKDQKLIYTRVLGHFEIPGSHRWIESHECWYCENHTYTLILSSKSICDKFFQKPRRSDKLKIQKKILDVEKQHMDNFYKIQEKHDKFQCMCYINRHKVLGCHIENPGSDIDDHYYDNDCKSDPKTQNQNRDEYYRNNQFAGVTTGWRCRSLLPMSYFLKMLEKNILQHTKTILLGKDSYENEIIELQEGRQPRYDAEIEKRRQKTMKNFNKVKFDNKKEQSKGDQPGWVDKMNESDQNSKQGWFNKLLELLPYKENANLVFDPSVLKHMDIAKKGSSTEKVYAYAFFMPPGRFSSSIVYNIDNYQQRNKGLYTMQIKAKPRDYDIKVRYKKVRQFRVERKFNQHHSIFHDWKIPKYREMLERDIEYSKIGVDNKYYNKDQEVQKKVVEVLYSNIQLLLDYFYYMIGSKQENYPTIRQIQFCDLMRDMQIQDDDLYIQDVDRMIIAACKTYHGIKSKDQLCRYEFFEILVRIAKVKYMEKSDVAKSNDKALELLINNHFKQNHLNIQTSQKFREEHIWQLDIDDLYRSNEQIIGELYRHFLDGEDPQSGRPNTHLDLHQCLPIAPLLGISYDDISIAYSYSKTIYIDEIQTYKHYRIMKIVEFYDFLVRLSDIKFKEEVQMEMLNKVERVLDILFKVLGKRREKKLFEIEVSSESDYQSE